MIRAARRLGAASLLGALALAGIEGCEKKKGDPEITCRVNAVCFVCPDEGARAKCLRDPASSRCKFAEPSHCGK